VKIKIVVGSVEIHSNGLDLNHRELRALLKYAASIALAVDEAAPEPVEPPRRQFGFALGADTEIAELIEPDLSEYFEEEE
jgi:hypothetical protein